MGNPHHDRLSALDASFLALEDHNTHMHIGAVALFDAAPLRTPDGGIDVDRIRAAMESGMHLLPRYRQRLAYVPLVDHPVWVDDERFNLAYHVRHTHLPLPGDERQLKRLAGRLMSQQLDRGKPLWEIWVVEGVAGDRFAVVSKVHHCMIDGVGSVELTGVVMRPSPEVDPRLEGAPHAWLPRPAPSPARLLLDEIGRRFRAPVQLAGAVGRAAVHPVETATAVVEAVEGVAEAMVTGFRPASETPLNVGIGPHRRFDWHGADLATIKQIKARLGGTINDVVLAVVAGSLRRFLRDRGLDPTQLEVRAMLPVNVRSEGDREAGNRVSMLVVRLPLEEPDPRGRLERVVLETAAAKQSRQAAGVRTIEEAGDVMFTSLFTEFARLAALARPFNLVVTNVPGPPFRVYMLGAPMVACYPLVPLYANQALGIALFSYDGRLYWGFNGDWDALPDLHALVEAVANEIEALSQAAADA